MTEEPTQFEDEIDLRRLLDMIVGGKWIVAGVTAACVLVALFYLYVTAPVYRADALLQIQSEASGAMQGLVDLERSLTGESKSRAESEMQIIRSRSVLGNVVNRLGLEIAAEPQHFPVIGEAVARRRGWTETRATGERPESGALGNYAWSRAEIDIEQFDVPAEFEGRAFTLTALDEQRYRLFGPEDEVVLDGRAGRAETAETAHGNLTLFVAAIEIGRCPVDFTVVKRPWLNIVQSLGGRLDISEQGRDTGIVQIALEGTDREHITRVVNEVAQTYLRQNVEARTEEAEKSLAFLDEQLPQLREQLRQSEDRLSRFQEQKQAVNLDAAGQALLQQAVELERRLFEMELTRNSLQQRYRPGHPELEALAEQMREVHEKREQLEESIGGLPEIQREIISLRRDVEVNTALYTSLLNRAQELKVIKAGTVGNVRIIDPAVPPLAAVKPQKRRTLALALMLGGMLGVGFVFARAALRRGITNPADIEQATGLPVYGVIPFSHWQEAHTRHAERQGARIKLLVREKTHDITTEALRSLRTSLYFAQTDAGSNLFLFTGPAPSIGKTFVSINLAALLAEAGQRVIFVDADMRRGALQSYTGGKREGGLSEILAGQLPWRDAVKTSKNGAAFDLITSGEFPPNPAELLMRPDAERLWAELKADYDFVIVDAPPILAVTDPVIIAAQGAITFLVARSGETQMQELEVCMQRLSRNETHLAGVILNGLKEAEAKSYGTYYGYYHYSYKNKTS